MILACHQPNFLPWVGYFDKMIKADIFVFLDMAELPDGGSWAKRTRIKTPDGPRYLTMPIHNSRGMTYRTSLIAATPTQVKKLWKTVEHNYARSPHFRCYSSRMKKWFLTLPRRQLWLANTEMIGSIATDLGITTQLIFQGMTEVRSHKNDLIIDLCHTLDCDTYLSGQGARAYNDEEKMNAAGIELRYQDFDCPEYDQPWGDFTPDLSIIDMMFNCGGEAGDLLGVSK